MIVPLILSNLISLSRFAATAPVVYDALVKQDGINLPKGALLILRFERRLVRLLASPNSRRGCDRLSHSSNGGLSRFTSWRQKRKNDGHKQQGGNVTPKVSYLV